MYDIMYDAKTHEKSNSKEESTITQSLGVQSIMVVRAWPLEYGRLVTPLFDRTGDPGPLNSINHMGVDLHKSPPSRVAVINPWVANPQGPHTRCLHCGS